MAASSQSITVKVEEKVAANGSNGNANAAAAAGAAPQVDKSAFWKRLKVFFDHWKAGGMAWTGETKEGGELVDAVVLAYGPQNEDIMYSRSAAIQLLLFGYDLPETIMVFSYPDTLTVLTAPKKAKLIRDCGDSHGELKLVVIEKDKNTLQTSYETLAKIVKGSRKGRRVGIVKKDQPRPGDEKKSTLVPKFMSLITKNGAELVDISIALAQTAHVKDEAGLRNVRRAAQYTSEVLKQHLLNSIENSIENDIKVTHSSLADKCDECIQNQTKLKLADKLEPENIESCYTPIIMSGGGPYDLKPSASSDDKHLDYTNTIILEVGTRYKGFCTNIGRTYFVDPSPDQKEIYTILTMVHAACLEAMKAGVAASSVMAAAERVIKGKKPALVDHFVKNCGFGIGLEFREPDLLLTKTNATILQPGMVFNLCIGFDGLVKGGKIGDKPGIQADSKEAKKIKGFGKSYAVLLADTVVVTSTGGVPEVLTNVNRSYDKVSYELDENADKAGDIGGNDDDATAGGRGRTRGDKAPPTRSAQQSAGAKMSAAAEEKLRLHQLELERKQREATLKRLAAQGVDKGFKGGEVKEGKFESYSDPSRFPAESRASKTVYVDSANESVLCPMQGGQMVPFHIQTIKNAHKSEENGWFYLRLQFHVPALSASLSAAAANAVPAWADHNAKFIRELTYRTKTGQLNKAFFDIQELRKRVTARLKEHQARSSLVDQEDLKVDMKKGAVAKLKDLQIKPQLAGRKGNAGFLEAHVNGFRFITSQKLKIDIIYKNIKHAFFQPAEKSTLNVLMHFELHNPIMLGKKKAKKTNYVQFYVEIMEASQDLDSRNRLDEDGLHEEQEERNNRRKWNEAFRTFVKRVEDHTTKESEKPAAECPKLEFDSPYRELVFTGTPSKSIVDIMPTVHCLVALDDVPPMVVTLADVEVAIFERVQFNLRNFDLVFILKGLEQTVQVQAIPSKHFDSIKQWLNSCDIVFYEMAHNILWKKVLKEIKSDLQSFYEDGGWRNLSSNAEGDSSDDGGDGGDGGDGSDADAGADGDSKEEKGSKSAKPKAKGKGKKKKKPDSDDESGSDFQPSGSDSDGSEDFTDGSEVSDSDDGMDSGASSGEDDDDGEGDDWDTLAKKAAASDRESNRREEEEDRSIRSKPKPRAPTKLAGGAKSKTPAAAAPKAKPAAAKPGGGPAKKPAGAVKKR